MPDVTTRMGLKKPKGNENFNRTAYNENLDILEQNAETINGAQSKVDTHATATNSVHGSTSAATANRIIQRDTNGRAKVASPSAADDIARKDTVDAVQTVLTGHIGTGGTSHASATTGAAGFMSAADKTKLDGVAAGANAYSHPTGDGNLHVPVTGTGNNGKVLKAGATAGSAAWGNVAFSEVMTKPSTLAGYGITDATPTRVSGGVFEYYNGTEWVGVGGGGGIMVASNTVRESRLPEYTHTYLTTTSDSVGLFYKFAPKYTGEVIISVDTIRANGSGAIGSGLWAYSMPHKTASNQFMSGAVDWDIRSGMGDMNFLVPLDTRFNLSSMFNASMTNQQDITEGRLKIATADTTTYQTFKKTMLVRAGVPIYFFVYAGTANADSIKLKDFKISYDVL
ncbi:hypothetical protein [Paenibacillus spongiae]|uniref:Tail fiber protein n=1 Tax=Paenibacillus spongiae TaxID=2909671 RepID=A0ABY5SH99_9BACL|nr:hypothetical protein [Paenibacillus spongiae]UVI32097.1 hypothetical protein L1F29_09870 [Paenibacillus spongiae]